MEIKRDLKKNVAKSPVCECDLLQLHVETSNHVLQCNLVAVLYCTHPPCGATRNVEVWSIFVLNRRLNCNVTKHFEYQI